MQLGSEGQVPRLCVRERPSEVPGPSRKGWPLGRSELLSPPSQLAVMWLQRLRKWAPRAGEGLQAPRGLLGGGGSWKALGRERGRTQEAPRVCACQCEAPECGAGGFAGSWSPLPGAGLFPFMFKGGIAPVRCPQGPQQRTSVPLEGGPFGHRVPGCQVRNLSSVRLLDTRPAPPARPGG